MFDQDDGRGFKTQTASRGLNRQRHRHRRGTKAGLTALQSQCASARKASGLMISITA